MTQPNEAEPSGSVFWVGVAMGWAVIGYGVAGLLRNAAETHPPNFLVFFLGIAVAHDVVLAPLVLALSWLGRRRPPAVARPALAAALIVSGTVTLYAYPFVQGYGQDPYNPSLLPNHYGWALATILAIVAATVSLWSWWTAHRRPRHPSPTAKHSSVRPWNTSPTRTQAAHCQRP